MGQQNKANPYPNGNFALMLDFLEELITVVSKEKGLSAISEASGGYQDIVFDAISIKTLKVPEAAVSATIMIEDLNSPISTTNVIRFKENGTVPTINSGFGLGHNDVYELVGRSNLSNFKAIGLISGIVLRVQYYQSAKQS